MVRTIIFSLWLPVLVLAASFVRFGFGAPADGPGLIGILMLIALTWPAAIPLTVAIRLINGRAPVLSYVCALLLGLGSAYMATVGGLLGPVGVVVYTIVASLPAWIVLGILVIFGLSARGQTSRV